MATIAVEIPAASAKSEQADALLRACSIAAAPDHCESAAEAEAPTAFAVLTWDGELSVEVEIGRPGAGDWLERRLAFAPEDPLIERWQAVGFAIGTLVSVARNPASDTPESETAAATPAPASTDSDPAPPQPAPGPARRHAVRLDVLGRAGTGTESSARFGGGFAVTVRHGSGPFAALDVNVDGLQSNVGASSTALAGRFLTLGTSLGVALPLSAQLELDLGAGPLVEAHWLWTDQAPTAQSRMVGGVRAIIAVRQRLGQRFWLGIGAQMGARFGDTSVTLDGQRVDSVPLVFATGALTLGFDVWQLAMSNAK